MLTDNELSEISKTFNAAMDEIRNEREDYWNSLSKEDQLKCFCAVVERIVKGEQEGHSYRGMLYTVFGFGSEAYVQAQMSGFLALHNSIFDANHIQHELESFAKFLELPDPEGSLLSYYRKTK